MSKPTPVYDKIDKIFKEIGEFGPYQLLVILLCGSSAIVPAMIAYSSEFYSANPQHRCTLPGWENNDTYNIQSDVHARLVEKYIPPSKDAYIGKYDSCQIRIFDTNETNSNFTLKRCNEWVYSKEYFGDTMITKWDLVCEGSKKNDLVLFDTLYFVGQFGALLGGTGSDRYGRKASCYTMIVGTSLFNIILTIVLNLVTNYDYIRIVFSICRIFLGSMTAIFGIATVLNIEICGTSKRVTAANSISYSYVVGMLFIVGIAYFLRDFKLLCIAYTVIMGIFLITFWFVPESPRWLMIKNRPNKAYRIFKRIAISNKKIDLKELETLNPLNAKKIYNLNAIAPAEPTNSSYNIIINQQTNTEENQKELSFKEEENAKTVSYFETFKVFFKTKKLILSTLVLLINWITNTLVYYGISFNTSRLAGDPYLNFFLSIIAELLADLACQFTLDRFGRKWTYSFNMTLSGICLLCVVFVPPDIAWIITMLALIAKFGISFTFNTIYIVTAEMYPTNIRNSAVAICVAFSRFGGLISPQVEKLRDSVWYPMPYIVYGAFAAASAIGFVLVITETKGKKIPDSIDEFTDH